MHVQTSVPVMIRLGIPGLSSLTDRMMSGGVYALIAETPPARYPILASSLACALNDGINCTIIAPSQPEAFFERIESFGQIDAGTALASQQMQLFLTKDNFSKNVFRFGADAFARELDYFEIPENSYLIFDQADELLSLHDISIALEQVEILRQWFGQRNITALLVFSRVTSSAGAMGSLRDLMDRLAGIVRVGGNRDGLELTFDYWQSPEGTVAAKSHQLLTLQSGLYKATTRELTVDLTPSFPRLEAEEPTEPRFFFTDPDLISLGRQMPGTWQHVDTLVGVLHASREHPQSTVILTFRQNTNLRQMAEAVHTLRHSLGRKACIVIQEKNASLRYQNEALLLRLGVNLVIHRDVAASRLPLLLESLKGQIFERDIGINFDTALASAMPSSVRGYLSALRFAREAKTIVERAANLNIPCALIVALPGRDMQLGQILSQIHMSRSGDLMTADQEHCYLFLSGCPEASLLSTLERVLGQPVNSCFDETRFVIQRNEIDAALNALQRAAERADLPDFSVLIEQQKVAALAEPAPQMSIDSKIMDEFAAPAKALVPEKPMPDALAEAAAGMSTTLSEPLTVAADAFRQAHALPSLQARPPIGAAPLFKARAAHADPADTSVPLAAIEKPAIPLAPSPASQQKNDAGADTMRFKYGGKLSNSTTFGKQEAPQATRALPQKNPHTN